MKSQSSPKWWQWLLEYPQLLIALLPFLGSFFFTISQAGIIFTAIQEGIALDQARIQHLNMSLFKKCSAFTRHQGSKFFSPDHPSYKIIIEECPKDIWLVTIDPGTGSHWDESKGFVTQGNSPIVQATIRTIVLDQPVFAEQFISLQKQGGTITIICTRFKPDGRYLIRRIRNNSTGKCYEETLDTATGRTIEKKLNTTCNPNCEIN